MVKHAVLMTVTLLSGFAAAGDDGRPLKDEKEKTSYAVGVDLGARLRTQSVPLDADLVARGLKDALAGTKTLLTADELSATLSVLRHALYSQQLDAAKQLAAKNQKESDEFLAANRAKEGVVTLASGLQYKVVKAGDGKKPAADDTVVCQYRGTLIDGKEFDSSYKRKGPATFPINRTIRAWSEALQLMPVGSKWELFVPPSLGYGARGSAVGIGPNSALVFQVELLSIKDKS